MYKKGEVIRNKRSKAEYIVWDVFNHIDCEKNREGMMYHLKRKGANQYKYVFFDKIDGYEYVPASVEEFETEQNKANKMAGKMRELCAANGGVVSFIPNIVGQLFK